jgi:riboflavin synthase
MFTGLVEELGMIRRVQRRSTGAQLVIGAQKVLQGVKLGDSIAVSGACLTVTAVGRDEFVADCMPETLERSTLGAATKGTVVNLERSLAIGDRLGGHLVLGHVDAVVVVKGVDDRGESQEVRLSLPASVAPFIAEKGSVALDGVSLTIMRVDGQEFVVGLIPHTIGATTLRLLEKGRAVNLEADVIARYVYRSLAVMGNASGAEVSVSEGLTVELLSEKGFV